MYAFDGRPRETFCRPAPGIGFRHKRIVCSMHLEYTFSRHAGKRGRLSHDRFLPEGGTKRAESLTTTRVHRKVLAATGGVARPKLARPVSHTVRPCPQKVWALYSVCSPSDSRRNRRWRAAAKRIRFPRSFQHVAGTSPGSSRRIRRRYNGLVTR